MNYARYTWLVLEAYQDEVAGAAYFDGLALAYPEHSRFFRKCALLERTTANRLLELVHQYELTPSVSAALERGAHDARLEAAGDWTALMRRSIESYGVYVAQFQAPEAMGPTQDQPVLAALTAHEVTLIGWMRAKARQ